VRIIAGRFKGRRLAAPPAGVRPTSDRVRERLFGVLESACGAPLPGGLGVDLFCGAGTLGIEALSRGAAALHFVDRSARSLAALERNLAPLREAGAVATTHRGDARRFVERSGPAGAVAWVFLDPPYDDPAGPACLAALAARHADRLGWVAYEGRGAGLDAPPGLTRERVLRCGGTVVILMRGGVTP
jgi:16S rRNA (guanine966-N2)-methyltransferase